MNHKINAQIQRKGQTPLNIKGKPEPAIRRLIKLITQIDQDYTNKYKQADRKATRKFLEKTFGKKELKKIMETE